MDGPGHGRRYPVRHHRDLPVAMGDGTVLRADRWFGAGGPPRRPTVLVRSPYGRRGVWGLLYGLPLAAAGWSVVISSVRGTSGRTDRFDEPMVHEAADGAATVDWLRTQPWWDGRLATIGMSYLGITQWALAVDPPPELAAMVVQVGPHEVAGVTWPGGALRLSDSLGWAQLVGGPWREAGARALVGSRARRAALERAMSPCSAAGGRAVEATGGPVPWWEEWARHGPGDAYWEPYDRSAALERVTVPVLLQGGWHDTFRRAVAGQYEAMAARGVTVGLTVGPWTHTGLLRGWPRLLGEARDWIAAAFEGATPSARVRTAVLGGPRGRRGWRTWPAWPPPSLPQVLHLGATGALDGHGPEAGHQGAGGLAVITHDPADPAPQVGGDLLGPGAGTRDQRRVEERADVAVWTGPPLRSPLEVAGTVTARITVTADAPHHLVVRLCDVGVDGRSANVCDGVQTINPVCEVGVAGIDIDLGPVAARWATGHRVRVQVAAGAWPKVLPSPVQARIVVLAGIVTLPVVTAGDGDGRVPLSGPGPSRGRSERTRR